MGIRTSGGEIIGILKLKDDMPAALANSLKADEDRKSDHTTLFQVKEEEVEEEGEEEEVVTHTATTETNFRQGDCGVEADSLSENRTWVAPAEIWPRDELEEVYALLFRFLGYGFLARDAEVRHSGARSHRLRAVAGAVRPRRALCDSCLDTAHVVVLCSSCLMTCHKSTGRAATLAMR